MPRKIGTPLHIHKNYIIRYISENPDQATDLIEKIECKTAEEAVAKLEEFPGDWIINGQLVSYDDPDLPESLRKKD